MLLARLGAKVLVVDRATFRSDTLSTHVMHPPGVAAMQRWGLLDRLVATGCPPIDTCAFDFGVIGIRGHSQSGATSTEHAKVVVGADGRFSLVAQTVGTQQYNEKPPPLCGCYSYWSNLPVDGRFEVYIRPGRGWAAAPTHDDLTLVVAGWPFAEFEANKADVEGKHLKMFESAPEFSERIRGAKRMARFAGTSVPNYFGNAGYNKDFITAQGITDAFRDAELCATALHEWLSGARPFDVAMGEYQSKRYEHVLPMFEFTTQLATLEPPPPDLQQVLGAVHGNQEAMDGFARVNAGVTSPAEFFSEDNIGRIFAAAAAR
jgi:2-polyprenyl-6-methoxyphenol hydroxylase-like FAD-dependent oxidoreductase